MSRTEAIRLLDQFGSAPFRVRDAVASGVPRYEVYRLRDSGVLEQVARGMLQRADRDPSSNNEFAVVCARVPGGIVCANSALAYWDLSDEIPSEVHLAIRRGLHPPRISTPATQIHKYAASTFELERTRQETETGEEFWIYSPARTVVDAARLIRYTGRDVAINALRRYLRRQDAEPLKLMSLARMLGGVPLISLALETLTA